MGGRSVIADNLIEPLGNIVSLIGSDDFGNGFYHIIDSVIDIDHCTVFVSKEDGPHTLVAEAQSSVTCERVRALAQNYVREGYRKDPIWDICRPDAASGCSTFLLSPTDLMDERYRQEFYVGPNIKHELALTAVVNGERVYAAFYRENGRQDFSQDQFDILKRCGRAIAQVLHKHGEIASMLGRPLQRTQPLSQKELLARVHAAIVADNNQLTAREAEICASIVLGYTVLGISLNLGISINTVATHRKRAYAKLRVSSQNELFARYFSIVENNMSSMRYN